MRVVADNDVIGAVRALERIFMTPGIVELTRLLEITFTDFEALGLPKDAPDRVVWRTCRAADIVLITGNRTGGAESLDSVLREEGGPLDLPVMTLADPGRILRDAAYAHGAALRLMDFLDRIESLRGTGRLFVS